MIKTLLTSETIRFLTESRPNEANGACDAEFNDKNTS